MFSLVERPVEYAARSSLHENSQSDLVRLEYHQRLLCRVIVGYAAQFPILVFLVFTLAQYKIVVS